MKKITIFLIAILTFGSTAFANLFDPVQDDAAAKWKELKRQAVATLGSEKMRVRQQFDNFWGPERNRKPMAEVQAVLDAGGTDACQVFIAHGANQDFIKAIDPSYVALVPPYNYTIHEDCTVTLSEKGN